MSDQGKAFVDADRQVTVFNKAWRNDVPFKNRAETPPALKRRKKWCKMCESLSKYVNKENTLAKLATFALYPALTTVGLHSQQIQSRTA